MIENSKSPTELPFATVVITAHNESEELLNRSLISALTQSLPVTSYKIIVVDDASNKEDTLAFLDQLQRHPRVKLIRNEFGIGLHQARMRALEAVESEYVIFLDADDALSRDALEIYSRAAAAGKADLIAGAWWVATGDGLISSTRRPPKTMKELITAVFRGVFSSSMCGHCWRTEVFDDVCGRLAQLPHTDDWGIMPLVLTRLSTYSATDKNVYLYDKSASTVTASWTREHLEGLLAAYGMRQEALRSGKLEVKNSDLQEGLSNVLAGKFGVTQNPRARDELRHLVVKQERPDAEILWEFYKRHRRGKDNDSRRKLAPTKRSEPLSEFLMNRDVILCQADYHVIQARVVAKAFENAGRRPVVLDMTRAQGLPHEKRSSKPEDFEGLAANSYIRWDEALPKTALLAARAVLTFNDYNPSSRDAWQLRNCFNLGTLAIVEGISDFSRLDSNVPFPYRSSDGVLGGGDFDQQFFADRCFWGVGTPVPEISRDKGDALVKSKITVAVNINFSYGVLEAAENSWVSEVLEVIADLGLEPIITQHPLSRFDLQAFGLSSVSQIEALERSDLYIGRFGTGLLFAIANSIPSVYYNPHCEKAAKFQNPLGAYQIASSKTELRESIQKLLTRRESAAAQRDRSTLWMKHHLATTQADTFAANVLTAAEEFEQRHKVSVLHPAHRFGLDPATKFPGPFDPADRVVVDATSVVASLSHSAKDVAIHVGATSEVISATVRESGWNVISFKEDQWLRRMAKFHSGTQDHPQRVKGSAASSSSVPNGSANKPKANDERWARDSDLGINELILKQVSLMHVSLTEKSLGVLHGTVWELIQPNFILVECADEGKCLFWPTAGDIVVYLQEQGYEVFIFEWHTPHANLSSRSFKRFSKWNPATPVDDVLHPTLLASRPGMEEKLRQAVLRNFFFTNKPTNSFDIKAAAGSLALRRSSLKMFHDLDDYLRYTFPLVHKGLLRNTILRRLIRTLKA